MRYAEHKRTKKLKRLIVKLDNVINNTDLESVISETAYALRNHPAILAQRNRN